MNRLFVIVLISVFLLITIPQPATMGESDTRNQSYIRLNVKTVEHENIKITSDQQIINLADSEQWKGDGSSENPYVIENFEFGLGFNDQEFFDLMIEETGYSFGGFTKYNLILSNVSLFVNIQNNNFRYSVVVDNSKNVQIFHNAWIQDDYPNNLFLNSEGVFVMDNTFDGSNLECESEETPFSPRVYNYGFENTFHHNIFQMDTGCYPVIQLYVDGNYVRGKNMIDVTHNLFRSSDIAISSEVNLVNIENNDFEVGDFALIGKMGTPFRGIESAIKYNNFYDSLIGTQGQQNYLEKISWYSTSYYQLPSSPPDTGYAFSGSVQSNYYDDWIGPDSDTDGVVDFPYLFYSKLDFSIVNDPSPQMKPNPGYNDLTVSTENDQLL